MEDQSSSLSQEESSPSTTPDHTLHTPPPDLRIETEHQPGTTRSPAKWNVSVTLKFYIHTNYSVNHIAPDKREPALMAQSDAHPTRLWVPSSSDPATFFYGDWSWNIFYSILSLLLIQEFLAKACAQVLVNCVIMFSDVNLNDGIHNIRYNQCISNTWEFSIFILPWVW